MTLTALLRPTRAQAEMVRRFSDTSLRVDLGPEHVNDGRACSLCQRIGHSARSCLKGVLRPKRQVRIVSIDEVLGYLSEPWAFAFMRLCLGLVVGPEEADNIVGEVRFGRF